MIHSITNLKNLNNTYQYTNNRVCDTCPCHLTEQSDYISTYNNFSPTFNYITDLQRLNITLPVDNNANNINSGYYTNNDNYVNTANNLNNSFNTQVSYNNDSQLYTKNNTMPYNRNYNESKYKNSLENIQKILNNSMLSQLPHKSNDNIFNTTNEDSNPNIKLRSNIKTQRNLINKNIDDKEELKSTNLKYKQILDTLFYFINSLSNKFNFDPTNNENVFSLAYFYENPNKLGKTLIELQRKIEDPDNYTPQLHHLIENYGINNNSNINDNDASKNINIIKEEDINVKNNIVADNDIDNKQDDLRPKIDQEINSLDNSNIHTKQFSFADLPKKKNKEKNKCIACLLGCGISQRGNSQNKYNPYNNKSLSRQKSSKSVDNIYKKKIKK